TEIMSPRCGGQIEQLLRRDERDREIITDPDIHRAGDNRYRLRLFNEFRGYADRTRLFGGFPRDVSWHRALITREELKKETYFMDPRYIPGMLKIIVGLSEHMAEWSEY